MLDIGALRSMIKKFNDRSELIERLKNSASTNRSGRYQSIKVQITRLCELFVRRLTIMMKPSFLEQLRKTI